MNVPTFILRRRLLKARRGRALLLLLAAAASGAAPLTASAGELARQLADVVLFQGVGFSFGYRVDNKDSNNN